jgi:hypothetical protein
MAKKVWSPPQQDTNFDAIDESIILFHQFSDEEEARFDNSKKDRLRAVSARRNAARVLGELRRRVEAGEAGDGVEWWPWCEENIKRSKRDCYKLLEIDGSPDPEYAEKQAREKNARQAKKSREKKKAAVEWLTSATSEPPTAEDATRIVSSLPDAQRQEFFKGFDPVELAKAFDPVELAVRLVQGMDELQRQAFDAAMAALEARARIEPTTPEAPLSPDMPAEPSGEPAPLSPAMPTEPSPVETPLVSEPKPPEPSASKPKRARGAKLTS